MEIQVITKKDISIICDWHKEHVAINFPDSKYKRKLFQKKVLEYLGKKNVYMIKIVEDRKMIAWLWLIKIWDEYKDLFYCDLHYIQVEGIHRGRGIGKQLMGLTEEWAKKNGMKEIRLGTSWDNHKAKHIYKKDGYKIKRVLMEKKI